MMGLSGSAAHSESLLEALSSAYLYNPTLKAARAQLRATDEEVPRAISGFRPTVSGQVLQTYQHIETNPSAPGIEGDTDPREYSVTLNQPLFRGFRTINAVKGAEALVEAGREDLRSSEQQVLFNSITAYVDVVRDTAVLELRQNNLRVLSEQLRAAQDRFEVGEVTKTDVAQARARTSGATSDISAARANLQASRATYAQLIGNAPRTLRDPGPSRVTPRSMEEALQIGEGENPTILSTLFRERAQDHAIKQVKGELLPSADLQVNYTMLNGETGVGVKREDITTVTGVLTVPIYQAGEVSARIRQNIETRSQLRHQIDEAREAVRANIISAWGVLVSARAQIISDQAQVDANQIALAGVKEEEKVGQRTVLDVLNAEQELLNSQVNLVTSRRDLAVASYALLASIGRLSINTLSLPVEQYDPTKHYRNVKWKWIGWSTSVEESEAGPAVAPVTATGRTPGQPSGDGPAYTGSFRDFFAQ
ncbi:MULTISPECIES: TolC family outer membrane protein [Rhodomicrobium]|uniref:TolC family outer membrane protein n=1 Tax=Rhodomicrobium TaxID=1068 RepID=UPI001FD8758C|nr:MULTISPECIES: TolC family outer membrane protein [Rhodomicrobium]